MTMQLKAGVAAVDITPPEGIGLGGYPHHERHNTGVHDPLMASCLYLNDGVKQIALVCTDLLIYSKKEVRRVREAAAERTGIPAGNIMITSSHSHSAPRTAGRLDLEGLEAGAQPSGDYLRTLRDKLETLIADAAAGAFDARVGIEKGFCGREHGVGGNRRDPMGIADPEVWTIGVQDDAGNWRGCLVKYALHPTILHSDNLQVSADYPGYIRAYLQRHKPGMVFLFAQGCSGNQSSRYFREGQTFAEADRMGSAIGVIANRVLDSMALSPEISLDVTAEELELPLRELPPLEEAEAAAESARREWERIKNADASYRDVWNAELRFLGAEDTLGYVRIREQGKSLPMVDNELPAEIQILRIGDTCLVGVQGEIFVEWGLDIQHRAPCDKSFVVSLANGGLPGYACTARAYAAGGYETGASMLTAESGQTLTDTAVDMVKELAAGTQ